MVSSHTITVAPPPCPRETPCTAYERRPRRRIRQRRRAGNAGPPHIPTRKLNYYDDEHDRPPIGNASQLYLFNFVPTSFWPGFAHYFHMIEVFFPSSSSDLLYKMLMQRKICTILRFHTIMYNINYSHRCMFSFIELATIGEPNSYSRHYIEIIETHWKMCQIQSNLDTCNMLHFCLRFARHTHLRTIL